MQHVTRLLRLMDAQLANYERLHDLLARKRAAIEANDLPALARAAQDIEHLIGENNHLEEQRRTEAAAVAARLGLRLPRPTVSRLLPRLPAADGAALAERSERLRAALHELQLESRTLHRVLALNLGLIDGMVRNMLAASTAGGQGSAGAGVRLLDQTV